MCYLVAAAVALTALAGCGGDVTRSAEAQDPPAPTIPSVPESDRAILQEPDVRLRPEPCPTHVPDGLRFEVRELGVSVEYKGCWAGGPTGSLAVGLMDAGQLPPDVEPQGLDTELEGLYVFAIHPNSSEYGSIGIGAPGFPLAQGDQRVVELRGLDETGFVVAVPAIAGWADLPETPEIEEADGTIARRQWVEIVSLDADGRILGDYSQ